MVHDWQNDLASYLRHEENTSSALTTPPPSPTSSTPQTSPTTSQPNLGPELRMLEAELMNCRMTRDALSRREAMLKQRQREIEHQLYSYVPAHRQELRHVAPTEEVEGAPNEQGKDEGLYMRDIQRAGKTVAAKADEEVKKKEYQGEKKPTVIGRKEAKRLALIELHRKTFGDRR